MQKRSGADPRPSEGSRKESISHHFPIKMWRFRDTSRWQSSSRVGEAAQRAGRMKGSVQQDKKCFYSPPQDRRGRTESLVYIPNLPVMAGCKFRTEDSKAATWKKAWGWHHRTRIEKRARTFGEQQAAVNLCSSPPAVIQAASLHSWLTTKK